jgi:hypothetical protein
MLIPYKITSRFFHPHLGREIDTPEPLIRKVQRVFDLWGSVATVLGFAFAGLEDEIPDTPADGAVHVDLRDALIRFCPCTTPRIEHASRVRCVQCGTAWLVRE